MRYGDLPKNLGIKKAVIDEMCFYQYLPIKLKGMEITVLEDRLTSLRPFLRQIEKDFIEDFGKKIFEVSYVYLTVKKLFQTKGCNFNRMGYHSDGFMTDDINYIWSDNNGTIFNHGYFNLTQNDSISINEMNLQADSRCEKTYKDGSLLRLNQFNIHKCQEVKNDGMRTFIKVSFSKDKYDLIGNSHNYLLNYDWQMRKRLMQRNIPQQLTK